MSDEQMPFQDNHKMFRDLALPLFEKSEEYGACTNQFDPRYARC
jgi:hypothetical protein